MHASAIARRRRGGPPAAARRRGTSQLKRRDGAGPVFGAGARSERSREHPRHVHGVVLMRSVGWPLLPWLCTASTAMAVSPAAPCDLYAAGGTPCVAAHSMTRALYRSYDGPLYRLTQPATNASRDVGVSSAGGRADSAVHNAFCKGAVCTVERIYDQSPQGNHLGVERGPSFLSGPRGEQDRAVGFADSRSRVMLG